MCHHFTVRPVWCIMCIIYNPLCLDIILNSQKKFP